MDSNIYRDDDSQILCDPCWGSNSIPNATPANIQSLAGLAINLIDKKNNISCKEIDKKSEENDNSFEEIDNESEENEKKSKENGN